MLLNSIKALADEKRLKILQILVANDLCVGALARQLKISKPAVSQHLQVLRKAGLVKGEKRGYWTHYVVDRKAISRVASKLNELAKIEKNADMICWRMDQSQSTKTQSKEAHMCQNCCQQPNKLMDKPQNCTPEQIQKCHGDSKEHPCTKENCTPDDK